jgi:hypothetical protein
VRWYFSAWILERRRNDWKWSWEEIVETVETMRIVEIINSTSAKKSGPFIKTKAQTAQFTRQQLSCLILHCFHYQLYRISINNWDFGKWKTQSSICTRNNFQISFRFPDLFIFLSNPRSRMSES